MKQREDRRLDFWSFIKGFAFGMAFISFGWGVRVFENSTINTIWVIGGLGTIGFSVLNIIGELILRLVAGRARPKEKDGDAR